MVLVQISFDQKVLRGINSNDSDAYDTDMNVTLEPRVPGCGDKYFWQTSSTSRVAKSGFGGVGIGVVSTLALPCPSSAIAQAKLTRSAVS